MVFGPITIWLKSFEMKIHLTNDSLEYPPKSGSVCIKCSHLLFQDRPFQINIRKSEVFQVESMELIISYLLQGLHGVAYENMNLAMVNRFDIFHVCDKLRLNLKRIAYHG